MKLGHLRTLVSFFLGLSTALSVFAREGDAIVTYAPSLTVVEGDQPLHRTVTLQITSPANVIPGSTVSITPIATVLSKPDSATNETALSYVTFSPATLDFSQPNQTLSLTVTVDVPTGSAAGGYAYRVETIGWAPGTQDPWAFLNATIYPQVSGDVPAVTIQTPADQSVFTYQPNVGPLTIPFQFTGSAPSVSPITTMDGDVNGQALTFTSQTNADGSITCNGTLTITAPGLYTLHARATNNLGTSEDSTEFTVNVSAPPPVVSIAQPTGPSYTILSGTTLTLPYSFSAQSYYGGITTLTATLNGNPVTFSPTGLGTLNASGTGNFALTTGGTYTLVVTATDQNGTATATRSFDILVTTPVPTPTVTISQPVNGTTITRTTGSPATSVPFTFTALANTGFTISEVAATLNGAPVTVTPTGLGTATAGGSGTLSISGPGTYTLVATGTSSGVVASASTTFTVTETTPPPPASCQVLWLPPINLNKVQQGGSVLPIKFKICCGDHHSGCGDDRDDDHSGDHCDDHSDDDHRDHGNYGDHNGSYDCDNGQHYGWGRDDDDEIVGKCEGDRDTSVVIAIYEIYRNGSVSAPTLYPYNRYSPNPPTYTIQGNNMYHLNFPVPKGKHTFRVEVYRTPSSSPTPQLLGAKVFTTK